MQRLLNVMFSEWFAHRQREIDSRSTRAELDSNQTHASSSIWTGIHTEFHCARAEYSKLASDLVNFSKGNLGIVVTHDAAKLRDIWKDISSPYNTALSYFRMSGMHDNDLFS